jgi:hypothetical protein
MAVFATIDENGFPTGFYSEDVHGLRKLPIFGPKPDVTEEETNPVAPVVGEKDNPDCQIPVWAIEITNEQYTDLVTNQPFRKWDGSKVVEHTPPTPEPEPIVTILPAITLWERLTEDEADQVNEAMATQPVRTQRIFTTANTFRSDHELWPLLQQMATELFGAERAAELLAP